MIGAGTLINVAAILIGSTLGVALGHRLPSRTRAVVTDGLGLITLLIAALSVAAISDPAVSASVGNAGVLIVLASLLMGGIIGSLLRIEDRLDGLGETLRVRLGGKSASRAKVAANDSPPPSSPEPVDVEIDAALFEPADDPESTFVEGFVTASLVFCVGPLAILGSLSDGLGTGTDQLALKSVMDGFASIAFAASLGWGVAASALVVAIYQGALTLLGWSLGGILGDAQVSLLTATGGLLLVGIALRLLRIRQIPVGDLLPALIVAPVLVSAVAAWR